MRIGIYPGSFNPVHNGHIKIAITSVKQKLVDEVLIVPTGSYWNKNNLVDLNHRINMLKIFESDTLKIETEYNITKSTYELFELLKKRYVDDELYLILGGDNLLKFEDWIEYRKMLEYPFVVVKRDEYDDSFIIRRMEEFNKDNYSILDIDSLEDSSTEIRESICENCDSDFLDDRVYEYIRNNNLYK